MCVFLGATFSLYNDKKDADIKGEGLEKETSQISDNLGKEPVGVHRWQESPVPFISLSNSPQQPFLPTCCSPNRRPVNLSLAQ